MIRSLGAAGWRAGHSKLRNLTIHRDLTPLCQRELRHLTPKDDTAPVFGGGDVDVALAMVSADPAGSEAPSVGMSHSTWIGLQPSSLLHHCTRFTRASPRSPAASLKTFRSRTDYNSQRGDYIQVGLSKICLLWKRVTRGAGAFKWFVISAKQNFLFNQFLSNHLSIANKQE